MKLAMLYILLYTSNAGRKERFYSEVEGYFPSAIFALKYTQKIDIKTHREHQCKMEAAKLSKDNMETMGRERLQMRGAPFFPLPRRQEDRRYFVCSRNHVNVMLPPRDLETCFLL